MREILKKQILKNNINNLSPKDNQNLVDAFVWLIQEDKKQKNRHFQACLFRPAPNAGQRSNLF